MEIIILFIEIPATLIHKLWAKRKIFMLDLFCYECFIVVYFNVIKLINSLIV
jgi:hypothetical protein